MSTDDKPKKKTKEKKKHLNEIKLQNEKLIKLILKSCILKVSQVTCDKN